MTIKIHTLWKCW